jgi:hypothetical protein
VSAKFISIVFVFMLAFHVATLTGKGFKEGWASIVSDTKELTLLFFQGVGTTIGLLPQKDNKDKE